MEGPRPDLNTEEHRNVCRACDERGFSREALSVLQFLNLVPPARLSERITIRGIHLNTNLVSITVREKKRSPYNGPQSRLSAWGRLRDVEVKPRPKVLYWRPGNLTARGPRAGCFLARFFFGWEKGKISACR